MNVEKYKIEISYGETLSQPIKITSNFVLEDKDAILIVIRDNKRNVLYSDLQYLQCNTPNIAYVDLHWTHEESEKYERGYYLWDCTYYQNAIVENGNLKGTKVKALFRDAVFNILGRQSTEEGVLIE